jgi:hypothetical protein
MNLAKQVAAENRIRDAATETIGRYPGKTPEEILETEGWRIEEDVNMPERWRKIIMYPLVRIHPIPNMRVRHLAAAVILGHIVLGHDKIVYRDRMKETLEAREFSGWLLNPGMMERCHDHDRVMWGYVLACMERPLPVYVEPMSVPPPSYVR